MKYMKVQHLTEASREQIDKLEDIFQYQIRDYAQKYGFTDKNKWGYEVDKVYPGVPNKTLDDLFARADRLAINDTDDRGMASANPEKALGKLVINKVVKHATDSELDNSSSIQADAKEFNDLYKKNKFAGCIKLANKKFDDIGIPTDEGTILWEIEPYERTQGLLGGKSAFNPKQFCQFIADYWRFDNIKSNNIFSMFLISDDKFKGQFAKALSQQSNGAAKSKLFNTVYNSYAEGQLTEGQVKTKESVLYSELVGKVRPDVFGDCLEIESMIYQDGVPADPGAVKKILTLNGKGLATREKLRQVCSNSKVNNYVRRVIGDSIVDKIFTKDKALVSKNDDIDTATKNIRKFVRSNVPDNIRSQILNNRNAQELIWK